MKPRTSATTARTPEITSQVSEASSVWSNEDADVKDTKSVTQSKVSPLVTQPDNEPAAIARPEEPAKSPADIIAASSAVGSNVKDVISSDSDDWSDSDSEDQLTVGKPAQNGGVTTVTTESTQNGGAKTLPSAPTQSIDTDDWSDHDLPTAVTKPVEQMPVKKPVLARQQSAESAWSEEDDSIELAAQPKDISMLSKPEVQTSTAASNGNEKSVEQLIKPQVTTQVQVTPEMRQSVPDKGDKHTSDAKVEVYVPSVATNGFITQPTQVSSYAFH